MRNAVQASTTASDRVGDRPARLSPAIVYAAVVACVAAGWAGPTPVVAAEKLYVLSSHGDDMAVIDVATDKILRYVKVGAQPHGIAAPRSQDILWVANEHDSTLTAVDPLTDKVIGTYSGFGGRLNEIEITPDGRFIYVPAYSDGTYEVFDTQKKKIIKRIPVKGKPHNVVTSSDGRRMYLSPLAPNNDIYVVDTSTHSVITTIDVANGARPIAISPDDKWLYVNTDNLLGFLVLDLASNKIVATCRYKLTEEEEFVRSRSHGIAVTPDGKEIWSCDVTHNLIHAFDATQFPPKHIARVATGGHPYWVAMTPDGKTLYVPNTADDTISVIDVRGKKERARIQIGKGKGPKRMLVLMVPDRAIGVGD